MNKLDKLLQFEAKQLSDAFAHAKIQGAGTPQGVSDFREIALTRFLERFFPYPYQIKKGNIIDSYGDQSNSIDCIILNPAHPKTISNDNKTYDLIIADATDYAIELKPDLSRDDEFRRLIKQGASVKRLRRAQAPLFANSLKKLPAEHRVYVENLTREIPFFVFTESIFSDDKLVEFINELQYDGLSPHLLPDFIINHQQSIFINVRYPNFVVNISDVGLYKIDLGDLTISHFLELLNMAHASVLHIMKPAIMHYFSAIRNKPSKRLISYNINRLICTYASTNEGEKPMRKES